jgi:hypothetical protein
MIGNFLRGLAEAVLRPDGGSGYDARLLPRHGWQCECGGHSQRPGFLSELDAEFAAQQHQWRKGVGHPMPEIVPEDAPGL